jgi:hypothetical protein
MWVVHLWNNLPFLQWASIVAALLLTIGAIVEYWAKLRILVKLFSRLVLLRSI